MMKPMLAAEGAATTSFRDPAGFVVDDGVTIIRYLTVEGAASFDAVSATGLLDRLVAEDRLVDFAPAGATEAPSGGRLGAPIVASLRHPRLPLITYPMEWPFAALKSAALFHLDLIREAMDRGVKLHDASAYNVQFIGTKPIFIDHLSFASYTDGEYWYGHDQFCRQFLAPLLFEAATGNSFAPWYAGSPEGLDAAAVMRLAPLRWRLRPTLWLNLTLPAKLAARSEPFVPSNSARPLPKAAYLGVVKTLRAIVNGLEPPAVTTTWQDYGRTRLYDSTTIEAKRVFVREAVHAAHPRCLWDLGCNDGEFALLALEAGAESVIGIDTDRGALEAAWRAASRSGKPFLPLHADILNPTPATGWANAERRNLTSRCNADFVTSLAVLHHVVLGGNVPLDRAVRWIASLAKEGVIEFVPKQDPMAQRLLFRKGDIFPDYHEAALRALLGDFAPIVAEARLPNGRILFHYRRPA